MWCLACLLLEDRVVTQALSFTLGAIPANRFGFIALKVKYKGQNIRGAFRIQKKITRAMKKSWLQRGMRAVGKIANDKTKRWKSQWRDSP
jgi:hypothetical protein